MKMLSLFNWILTIALVILVIASVLGGLYLGFWLMFVGGIVDLVNAAKADHTDAYAIAFGILKIVLFELPIAGSVAFAFLLAGASKLLPK